MLLLVDKVMDSMNNAGSSLCTRVSIVIQEWHQNWMPARSKALVDIQIIVHQLVLVENENFTY